MPNDKRADVVRSAREFFYVDLQRARSYYAQLNRGVVDSVLFRDSGDRGTELAADFLGLHAGRQLSKTSEREESRSLQDLTFVILEELLAAEGLIADAPGSIKDESAWRSGAVHGALTEGQIVRYTGSIQILDPAFFAGRLKQFERLARAFTAVTPEATPSRPAPTSHGSARKGPTPARPKSQAIQDAAFAAMLGFDPNILRSMSELVAAFTGDTIQLRVLPAGAENPDCHFAAALLGRSEYIQEEREALFSRYGTRLDDWTVVMQIAKIPEASSEAPDAVGAYSGPTDRIDRAAIEGMALQLLRVMEGSGIAEGPSWPAISVTPLAIYRKFESGRR